MNDDNLDRAGVPETDSVSGADGIDARLKPQTLTHRVMATDGTQEVTYSCGHSAIQIVPLPAGFAGVCAQCVNDFTREQRELCRSRLREFEDRAR